MSNSTDTQNGHVPTKRRIGRLRFLVEVAIAGILANVGSKAYLRSDEYVSFTLLLVAIGGFLFIWASVRRLRDIRRSGWWTVLPFATPLLIGALTGWGQSLESTAAGHIFYEALYSISAIVPLFFLGVLLAWPSVYRKDLTVITIGEQSSEKIDGKGIEPVISKSMSNIEFEDEAFAQAAAELDTDQKDAAVWARAYSDAEGSENRARALYIRYRVQRIRKP